MKQVETGLEGLIVLLYEFDGLKYSGTLPARLKKFNIKIRGNKNEVPSERRRFVSSARLSDSSSGVYIDPLGEEVDVSGTVLQEGVILTKSESFARYLAHLVTHYGAKQAWLVVNGVVKPFIATDADNAIFARIQNAFSKRGRVSDSELTDWVITCHECINSHQIEDARTYINCPKCNSTNITARPGHIRAINPTGDTLVMRWAAGRLLFGSFEIPKIDKSERPLPEMDLDSLNPNEQKVIESIKKSKLMSLLEKSKDISEDDKLVILDAMFCSLAYHQEESRTDARVDVCAALYKNGITPDKAPIYLPSGTVDLLDAASALGTRKTMGWFYALKLNQ